VLTYIGGRGSALHSDAIRALMASPANAVIIPMQDVLGFDRRARMNTPGTLAGNWQWRLPPRKLDAAARSLRLLAEAFGRSGRARGATRNVGEGRALL
jgi:4-alpha-glucanotransferase